MLSGAKIVSSTLRSTFLLSLKQLAGSKCGIECQCCCPTVRTKRYVVVSLICFNEFLLFCLNLDSVQANTKARVFTGRALNWPLWNEEMRDGERVVKNAGAETLG